MSRRANPVLIGAFVLGALALSVTAVLLLAGGEVFRDRKQHILYFEGAAQGLQVGAPVMFLGVQVGVVKKIQIGLDEQSGRFTVPVTILIEPDLVHTRSGEAIDLRDPDTLQRLVQRGLRARLRMQSLLTGQLYVALDFYPDKPARYLSSDPAPGEIPTIPGPVQELTARMENFPVERFLADVAAIGQSVSRIAADPATGELPAQLRTVLGHLESLAAKLDAEAQPTMSDVRKELAEMHATLGAAQSALARVESAADRVGSAADRIGSAADRIGALASPDAEILRNMSRASGELASAARSLRDLTAEDAPTVQNLNATLTEMARAARALRVLAETLDRQPEALIRGKKELEGMR